MINLLPPQYQEEMGREENRRLAFILGMIFLTFLISVILILFSVKIYIQGQLKSVKVIVDLEEKTLQTAEMESLKEEINLVNQKLSKLNGFYKNQVNSIEILEKIFKTLPPNIRLNTFSWQKNTSQVTMSGFSPSREVLFGFKNNLEETKEFVEIYFPPQNWIKPTDIDFYVTFKITQ